MIDSININGVRYSVTPAEEGQSGNIFTFEGVTYSIGNPVTTASSEIAGSVDKISVGGKIYDIRDKEDVEGLRAAITQMGEDLSIAIDETVKAEASTREIADNEIRKSAAGLERFSISPSSESVSVSFHSLDNTNPAMQIIPSATTEKAGVMSAEDKKRLDGVEAKIEEEFSKIIEGVDPDKIDSIKDFAAWIEEHGAEVEGITTAIQKNATNINAEATRAKEAEQKITVNASKEKTALINGDTIVGVAREVYSRQGKTDTATFLRRTTAGGTSISDGIASIKHIGGNIIKNLVSYNNVTHDKKINLTEHTNIYKVEITAELGLGSCNIVFNTNVLTLSHKYYIGFSILSDKKVSTFFTKNYGGTTVFSNLSVDGWDYISNVVTVNELSKDVLAIFPFGYNGTAEAGWSAYFSRPTVIDLTEMYGDGNEPTKEECDKMFAATGTLPQGITVAQPTGFKSIGFNQWNPANKLEGKGIINNTITDAETDIAFMECLPCKVGTGENNGYIIGYGEGDSWNDTGVEVYFSPNSVFDTDGAYIQKLTKDATYNTYVPRVAGYLFIVTPTTEKLCAHLHWSGDREVTDYEEYVESNVTLPTIPQMSEWGLAGLVSVKDTIDLDENKYTKTIDRINLKEATFSKITRYWRAYVSREQTVYSNVDFSVGGPLFYTDINNGEKIEGDYNNVTDAFTDTNGVAYARAENYDMPKNLFLITLPNLNPSGFDTSKKPIALSGYFSTEKYTKSIFSNNALFFAFNKLGITHTANSVEDLKSSLAEMPDNDTMLYYPATPVEYPIVTKAAPNYIGSDYGVEQFTGSKVPLAANILFYMRSLVSETRNFLDRLMAGLGSDVTEVADKIIAAVKQHNVEPEESTE